MKGGTDSFATPADWERANRFAATVFTGMMMFHSWQDFWLAPYLQAASLMRDTSAEPVREGSDVSRVLSPLGRR